MAKYDVIERLSRKQGRDILPGETVELDDDTAAALLKRGAIRPAEYQYRPVQVVVKHKPVRRAPRAKKVEPEPETPAQIEIEEETADENSKDEELDNGTDN